MSVFEPNRLILIVAQNFRYGRKLRFMKSFQIELMFIVEGVASRVAITYICLMSGSPKVEGRFRLDVSTAGDDIGASFAVRNINKQYPIDNVVDTVVEADLVPYRYQVGSKLRRALHDQDRRETEEAKQLKTKSKL
ncbi:unnamed protein product [Strongylus vulgaris]|uniref:Uncharacterized protein n=1 Tax=Strongylus vulgaris TaxID=40348 RepID=A0A3P7KFT8_STRVU|nr:unnamed protein product [Strongylus vulgaris]